MTLPTAFCWTRFGTEAGERAADIFARKEHERERNDGVFLWGIGTSIRPSLIDLLAACPEPQVLFSPMRSKAARRDAEPAGTVLWTSAIGLDGNDYDIPEWSVVTSSLRGEQPRRRHYALVCHSSASLDAGTIGTELRLDELRNLSNDTNIGSSQVTCVVRRRPMATPTGLSYRVAVAATLAAPYFVALGDPCVVPESVRIDRAGGDDRRRVVEQLVELRARIAPRRRARQLPLAFVG